MERRNKSVPLSEVGGCVFQVGERDTIFDVKEMPKEQVVAVILRNCTTLIFNADLGQQTAEVHQLQRTVPITEEYLERKETFAARLIDEELFILAHVETVIAEKSRGTSPTTEYALIKVNSNGFYSEVGSYKLPIDTI